MVARAPSQPVSSPFETLALCEEVERLVRIERKAAWLLCHHFAELADRFDRKDPALDAYDDIYQLASLRLGMGERAVRERIRVGRALRQLPQTRAAFAQGTISFAKVREVTRVAEPESETEWLDAARAESVRSLERRVAHARGGPAPTAARGADMKHASDGAFVDVQLRVPAETWALVLRAMKTMRERSQSPLSDAEALAAVARWVIASPSSHGPTEGTAKDQADESFLDDLCSRTTELAPPDMTRPGHDGTADQRRPDETPSETPPGPDERLVPAPRHSPVSAESEDAARTIVSLIERGEGNTPDELIVRGRLSVSCVAVTVLELELAGIVAQTHRGLQLTPWARRHRFNAVPSKLRH